MWLLIHPTRIVISLQWRWAFAHDWHLLLLKMIYFSPNSLFSPVLSVSDNNYTTTTTGEHLQSQHTLYLLVHFFFFLLFSFSQVSFFHFFVFSHHCPFICNVLWVPKICFLSTSHFFLLSIQFSFYNFFLLPP